MEFDALDPTTRPTRGSLAAPAPFADVLPPGLDLLIERLEQHGQAARGAFADNTVLALAADSRHFAEWLAAASLESGALLRPQPAPAPAAPRAQAPHPVSILRSPSPQLAQKQTQGGSLVIMGEQESERSSPLEAALARLARAALS